MRLLYLSDNSWVIKRDEIKDDTGAVPTGTARCFLAADKDDIAAIDPTLEVSGVAMTGGSLRAVISGGAITDNVEPMLAAAELAGEELDIYDRVIVAGAYSDFEPLRVKRDRQAGRP
jgi:hypothetical protein